ncbi:acetyl-CoA carboxylase biotin carboxylase subunit family protein [Kitasatospora sp. NPDC059327]|uniref:ATP-grasp domain-containing protein n=1 Tax=Kitasatospora sp. NPDC059327 TaxID=3346803 RepID=UPI0036D1848E
MPSQPAVLVVGPSRDHAADLQSVAETRPIAFHDPDSNWGGPDATAPTAGLDGIGGEPPAGLLALTAEALPQAADLAETLGLRGPSKASADASTDRSVARILLAEAGVPTPRGTRVDSHQDAAAAALWTGYPVVLRPLANLGHYGAIRADTPEDLQAAWTFAHTASLAAQTTPGAVLLERAHGGEHVTLQTITSAGLTRVVAAARTAFTNYPLLQPTSHLVTAEEIDPDLAQLAARAIQAIGVDHGVGHVHIVMAVLGPVITDAAAHLQGDSVPELVRLATGVDLLLAAIQTATGQEPATTPTRRASAAVALIRAGADGTVTGQAVDPGLLDAPWLARLTWETPLRGLVQAHPASLLARCVVTGPDPDTCLNNLEQARRSVQATVQSDHAWSHRRGVHAWYEPAPL